MTIALSNRSLTLGMFAVGLWVATLPGCASRNPFVSEGPEPRVENCMLLQQATPAKFVCGGKTMTAVQLSDIRTAANTPPAK
jgi:hypothetical protein